MASLVYSHPLVYKTVMRFLYAGGYNERLQSVASYIPAGSSVTELCSGFGDLYLQALKHKNIAYTGYDLNPGFVRYGKNKGLNLQLADINSAQLVASDYVVIQSSLYQFIPNHKQLIDRALSLANKQVIITEPVRNLSDSPIVLLAWVARKSADPGTGHKAARFNKESAQAFFQQHYKGRITAESFVADGREILVVLNAQPQNPPGPP